MYSVAQEEGAARTENPDCSVLIRATVPALLGGMMVRGSEIGLTCWAAPSGSLAVIIVLFFVCCALRVLGILKIFYKIIVLALPRSHFKNKICIFEYCSSFFLKAELVNLFVLFTLRCFFFKSRRNL